MFGGPIEFFEPIYIKIKGLLEESLSPLDEQLCIIEGQPAKLTNIVPVPIPVTSVCPSATTTMLAKQL